MEDDYLLSVYKHKLEHNLFAANFNDVQEELFAKLDMWQEINKHVEFELGSNFIRNIETGINPEIFFDYEYEAYNDNTLIFSIDNRHHIRLEHMNQAFVEIAKNSITISFKDNYLRLRTAND